MLSGTKILVVEDDPFVSKAMQVVLEISGCDLMVVNDGRRALQAMADFEPELVVTDIVMPDIDGLGFIAELRKHYPDVPVLAISGAGSDHGGLYLKLASKMGADAILSKPVRADKLLEAIGGLLNRHAA